MFSPAGSVWYSFTPNQNGVVKIKTVGSTYDTAVAAYTGAAVNALTLIDCNDDTGTALTSGLQFSVDSGTTYRIQIGSLDVAGDLTFDMVFGTTPANDNFASALNASPLPYTNNQSTIVATTEASEPPDCLGVGTGRTVWYNFTAPLNGTVTVTTAGSDFDTVVAVYTGSALGTLLQVDCNDDTVGTTSEVQFTGASGTTYRIQV